MKWLLALWWATRPRCSALPPPHADADLCTRPRGHEMWGKRDAAWHTDGAADWDGQHWEWRGW